ncbi:FAD-binding oxidoreductase [Salinilacihabitans rarus]|uniref:FAD-binding oxidoreductase n=1 Tax=Salinilacihabitans rarus TaxID=2961596 RepID=UPI0020C8AF60|nr:FAD-binding oxidoreductase [Salinilacihabitans rarus]
MTESADHPGAAARSRLPAAAVDGLCDRLRGEVILPVDAAYDERRRVWNGTIDRYPALIAACRGTADVVDAVAFAREHDLPLSVRGGGHNVSGSAVFDGGLVVDLSAMRGVRVDPRARTARVEGGAELGDVDRETQLFGLATPLGVVSETGVAGLTLNGGVGHLRRAHGLACDALRSVDVVTADGAVVTASAEEHADLFWAVRGGGGNFGAVTSFEYDLHPVGPEVYGLFAWFPGAVATDALRRFREYAATASTEASVLAFTATVPDLEEFPADARGESAIVFLGCHLGDPETAEAEFEPFRTVAAPIADASGPTPYVDLQSLLDEDYPDGLRYYWKSVYVDDLTDDLIEAVVRLGAESPSDLSTVDIWHLGGAVADVPADATAFAHRDRPYMLTLEANWEAPADDDANVAWAREGVAEVRDLPGVSGGYGNFPGFDEDPAKAIFGENYERLRAVKREYDPTNLFRPNGNVPPAAE